MPQMWNEWNETSSDIPVPKRLARRVSARGNNRFASEGERGSRMDRQAEHGKGRYQLHAQLRRVAEDQESWEDFDEA